ncbi:hypothetical protein SAMN04488577_3881 [Bacillus sp. cl95]|nr:hypothetical protein SAMN02799634_10865 [Bacillus sp. UNCCL13]SFQ90820.1 hypothetical protein SAMN04488577_3881 [Bacillus sp. cl95]
MNKPKAHFKEVPKHPVSTKRPKVNWRPHFSSGILTCFIRPKYRYANKDYIYSNSGFYSLISVVTLVLNMAWVIAIPFLIFSYSESVDGFMRVTLITFIVELIYKAVHSEYKYF